MYLNCIIALGKLRKEPLLTPCIRFLTSSARTWLAAEQPHTSLSLLLTQCAAILGLKEIFYNLLVNLSYQLQITQEQRDGVLDSDYFELYATIQKLIEQRSLSPAQDECNLQTELPKLEIETQDTAELPDGLYDPQQVLQFLTSLSPILDKLRALNLRLEKANSQPPNAKEMNPSPQELYQQLLALNKEFLACYQAHGQDIRNIQRDVRDLFAHCLETSNHAWHEVTLGQLAQPSGSLALALQAHYPQFVTALCDFFDRNQPFERIVGYSEILRYGKLKLNQACLIPRFDTYNLVCEAFGAQLRAQFEQFLPQTPSSAQRTFRILDLGAGTGLMGLSLLEHLREHFDGVNNTSLKPENPQARFAIELHFVDLNPQALEVALANAQEIYQDFPHITIVGHLSDWYRNLPPQLEQSFHVILSNPRYLAHDDPHFLALLDDEPHMALVAPESGLSFYRTIIAGAPRWLNAQGLICLEHGHTQSQVISAMFDQNWEQPQIGYDLGTSTKRGLLSRLRI